MTEQLIIGDLSPLVAADAYSKLLGNLPIDFDQFRVAIDLIDCEWIIECKREKVFANYRRTIGQTVRLRHNEAIIKQWMKKTDMDFARPQLSETQNYYFSRIRPCLVVGTNVWDRRYAFFIHLGVSANEFEERIGGASHLQTAVVKYKALDKATKTPICYLDELVSHFTLPVPPGLKYLALFRLFLVTVDDDDTNSKKRKCKD